MLMRMAGMRLGQGAKGMGFRGLLAEVCLDLHCHVIGNSRISAADRPGVGRYGLLPARWQELPSR